jgi:hypothetical protein
MQHLEEGTIHAWLDGALSTAEQASVEQHVRQCSECAAMVAEARGMIAGASRIVSALDVVPGGVIPRSTTPPRAEAPTSLWRSLRLTPFRAALAASLMIATASLFVVRRESGKTPSMDSSVVVPAVADRPPTTAQPLAPSPEAKRAEVAVHPASPRSGAGFHAEPRPAAPVAAPPPVDVARADVAQSTDSTKSRAVQPAPPPTVVADAKAAAKESQADVPRDRLNPLRAGAASGMAGTTVQTFRAGADLSNVASQAFAASRRASFVGCYQFVRDSLYSPSVLPERFALDESGDSGAVRHVVRAVGADGRIDTAITSAAWSPMGPTMVNVSLTTGAQRQVVRIYETGSGLTADVPGRADPVRVVRSVCKR